jgi:hypothetical protein
VGSYLLQELKKACYLAGRVPAAWPDGKNTASRSTPIKTDQGLVESVRLYVARRYRTDIETVSFRTTE